MPDTSGPSSLAPLAFYDPDSSCWRMSRVTSLWGSEPYSATLPKSGMTLAGELYELPMSALVTAVPASSSLLPTPTSQAAKHAADDRGEGSLDDCNLWSVTARLLPTPTTEPMTGNGHARNLGKEVALLPTPAANEYEHSDVDAYLARRERCKETAVNGNGFGLVLSMAVKMLPTPTTSNAKGPSPNHGGTTAEAIVLLGTPRVTTSGMRPSHAAVARGELNSRLEAQIESLTGALTAPPSPATPPSSGDPHPTLWTDEDD